MKESPSANWLSIILAFLFIIGINYFYFTGQIDTAKILDQLQEWYVRYGYLTVFISSLLEGLLVIGSYLPGSSAIVLGVAFANQNGLSVPLFIGLITLGFFISYNVNYFIGRYAVKSLLKRLGYDELIHGTSESLREKGPRIMLTTFFHPTLGILTSTGAGVIKMPYRQFALWCLASLTVWNIFWGIAVTLAGDLILRVFENKYLLAGIILLWYLVAVLLIPRLTKKSEAK